MCGLSQKSFRRLSAWALVGRKKSRSPERMPSQPTVHKTYQYKLKPTPAQEQALEEVVWRCRVLYNTALEQRITWWQRGEGLAANRFQQEAELKDLRAAFPEYTAIHSHVLQDV